MRAASGIRAVCGILALMLLILFVLNPPAAYAWNVTDPVLRQRVWDTVRGSLGRLTAPEWARGVGGAPIRIPWAFFGYIGFMLLMSDLAAKSWSRFRLERSVEGTWTSTVPPAHDLSDTRGARSFHVRDRGLYEGGTRPEPCYKRHYHFWITGPPFSSAAVAAFPYPGTFGSAANPVGDFWCDSDGTSVQAAYAAWIGRVGFDDPVQVDPKWPGTNVSMPATLDAAVTSPHFAANVPQLNDTLLREVLRRFSKAGISVPPATRAQYHGVGIYWEPDLGPFLTPIVQPTPAPTPPSAPTPGPGPTPGPAPTLAPAPTPGPEPAPPADDVVTATYMRQLISWMTTTLRATQEWTTAQVEAQLQAISSMIVEQFAALRTMLHALIAWLQAEIAKSITWLGNLIVAQVAWLAAELRALFRQLENALALMFEGLGLRVDAIAEAVERVETAVAALPEQVAAKVTEAIGELLEDLFVPSPATLERWESIPTIVQGKPPLSLLPPVELFTPAVGGSACAFPDVGPLDFGGMSVGIEWPPFVCVMAGYVRTFFLAMLWVVVGVWVVQRVIPQLGL